MSYRHRDLPPFLCPLKPVFASEFPYRNAVFRHQPPLGPTHALWWPCRITRDSPSVVLLFIPGNPGLLEFYVPFLFAIHNKDSSGRLAILAHAHAGHTPGIGDTALEAISLARQVQGARAAFDAVTAAFPTARVILVGHSVGAWISLQVLNDRNDAASAFLLFPTISHIASTPNGRRLSWLFRYPLRNVIAWLSRVTILLPPAVLAKLFSSWPIPQLLVLQKFLNSSSSVYAALTMAHDEMETICDLDVQLLNVKNHRLWLYFAGKDDWVGEQREYLLQAFDASNECVKIVHGDQDIPHAFCINHGTQLAEQCDEWIDSGGFF